MSERQGPFSRPFRFDGFPRQTEEGEDDQSNRALQTARRTCDCEYLRRKLRDRDRLCDRQKEELRACGRTIERLERRLLRHERQNTELNTHMQGLDKRGEGQEDIKIKQDIPKPRSDQEALLEGADQTQSQQLNHQKVSQDEHLRTLEAQNTKMRQVMNVVIDHLNNFQKQLSTVTREAPLATPTEKAVDTWLPHFQVVVDTMQKHLDESEVSQGYLSGRCPSTRQIIRQTSTGHAQHVHRSGVSD